MLKVKRVNVGVVENLNDGWAFESVRLRDKIKELLKFAGVLVLGKFREMLERFDAVAEREGGNEAGHLVEKHSQRVDIVCGA